MIHPCSEGNHAGAAIASPRSSRWRGWTAPPTATISPPPAFTFEPCPDASRPKAPRTAAAQPGRGTASSSMKHTTGFDPAAAPVFRAAARPGAPSFTRMDTCPPARRTTGSAAIADATTGA
nr:hypothetical protein [Corynebacterium hansenii]